MIGILIGLITGSIFLTGIMSLMVAAKQADESLGYDHRK